MEPGELRPGLNSGDVVVLLHEGMVSHEGVVCVSNIHRIKLRWKDLQAIPVIVNMKVMNNPVPPSSGTDTLVLRAWLLLLQPYTIVQGPFIADRGMQYQYEPGSDELMRQSEFGETSYDPSCYVEIVTQVRCMLDHKTNLPRYPETCKLMITTAMPHGVSFAISLNADRCDCAAVSTQHVFAAHMPPCPPSHLM